MPLSDMEVLALLRAAPCDHDATHTAGGDIEHVRPGHVTPWEQDSAKFLSESTYALSADGQGQAKRILARVYGLPERAHGQEEPIVMTIAWASNEAREQRRRPLHARVLDRIALALIAAGGLSSTDPPTAVEVLCAEVLALRARLAG